MAGTWQISNDNNAVASGSASSISVSMSHAANALVIIASGIRLTSSSAISTCSVGGVAASKLTALSNGTIRCEVWGIFRSAQSTGETVQVDITPTNKQAFVAASFTATKNGSPFLVQTQAATASATTSAVSVTKGAGATKQRMLLAVAAVGGPTVSSVGVGQTIINQAIAGGGSAGTRASIELDYEDAGTTAAQTQQAWLSTAATSASIAIGLLPILTAAVPPEIVQIWENESKKIILPRTTYVYIMEAKTLITSFARFIIDALHLKELASLSKIGPQIFTVTVADAVQLAEYVAKTVSKQVLDVWDNAETYARKTIGRVVGCEPNA